MVAAALDAGVPCAWVLGDAVYGSDKTLRVSLEERDKPYVLAVRANEQTDVLRCRGRACRINAVEKNTGSARSPEQ
jgi:SRSO17 transposase